MSERTLLESISEMRERAKSVGHLEAGWSDADLFRDQFENGEYHNEKVYWAGLGYQLPNEELGDLGLAVIRYLISSGRAADTGLETKDLMNFHDALRRWQISQLKSADEILRPLAQIREALSKPPDPRALRWHMETFRALSMVELGIMRKIGLDTYDVSTAYDRAEEALLKR